MVRKEFQLQQYIFNAIKTKAILDGKNNSKIVEECIIDSLGLKNKKKSKTPKLTPNQFKLLEFFDKHYNYWFYIAQLESICNSGKIDMSARNISYCIPILKAKKLIDEIVPPEFIKNKVTKYYQITNKGRRMYDKLILS